MITDVACPFSTLEPPLKPTATVPQFHRELAECTTKAQAIEVMMKRLSFHGDWSDCPKDVRERVQKMAGR